VKFILTELELTASSVSTTHTYDISYVHYASSMPNKAARKKRQGCPGMKTFAYF